MKIIIASIAIICGLFISCNNNGQSVTDSSDSKSDKEKKISKRDFSVTRQNAYNDG